MLLARFVISSRYKLSKSWYTYLRDEKETERGEDDVW